MKGGSSGSGAALMFLSGALVGALLLAAGFVLGVSLLSEGFFSTKLHEWLGAVGTVGAFFAMVVIGNRESRWRREDRVAAGRLAWGVIAYETVRFKGVLESVDMEIGTFQDPHLVQNNALMYRHNINHSLTEVAEIVDFLVTRESSLDKLPPSISSSLGQALGLYPEWRRRVIQTISLGDLGIKEVDQCLAQAKDINCSMHRCVSSIVAISAQPEADQWA